MADWLDTVGKVAGVVGPLVQPGVNYLSNIRGQQVDRNAALQANEQLRATQGYNKFNPGLSKEQEILQARDLSNRVAPEQSQPAYSGLQNAVQTGALIGSIPGQVQKALPGLLGGIKRSGWAGAKVASLFEPDTSHYDEYARQQTQDFEERIIPQIMAQFGPGEELSRDRAIASARTNIQKEIVGMKANAYEKGLDRNIQSSDSLLNTGLARPLGQNEPSKEVEKQVAESLQVPSKKSDTGKISTDEYIKGLSKTNPKFGKQFSAIYDKADFAGKQHITNAITANDGKYSHIFSKFTSPEDFQKFTAIKNVQDPLVKKLVNRVLAPSNVTKNQFDQVFNALKEQAEGKDSKRLKNLMQKHGIIPKSHKSGNKEVLIGALKPILAMAAAPVASVAGAYALANPVGAAEGASAATAGTKTISSILDYLKGSKKG